MKNYRVTYIPVGAQDKKWCFFEGTSEEDVKKRFTRGTILTITETDEEYEDI